MNGDHPVNVAGDIVSFSIVAGTLAQVLPSVAAIVSIIWGCIRIYETRTVQGWLGRSKNADHD